MDKYCKFCGTQHTAEDYPKICGACNNTTWINPTPVAVLCVRVYDETGRDGILVGKRGIEPKKDQFGLPGGFVDRTDASFEAAAIRELYEEMGITLDVENVRVMHTFCDGRNILVFCYYDGGAFEYEYLKSLFVPSDECPEMGVVWEDEDWELCFPSHSKAARIALIEYGDVVDDDSDDFYEEEVTEGHC